jgi:two-component system, NarL family, nitrate/nitrite response regulator NarL
MSRIRSDVSNSGVRKFSGVYRPPKPIRTLVVDDSPIAVGAIRVLLEKRKEIQVVGIAGDGEEGVARAGDLQPDLILMDLQMPKLDGLSATRLIRERVAHVRIIVVTFMHGEEMLRACRQGGADGFVVKDRLYQDLLAEIERVFGGNNFLKDAPRLAN